MRKFLIIVCLTLNVAICLSSNIKTICGEYTYIVPDNISREEAKRIALERARLEALATTYGTLIVQDNTTYINNKNGKSDIAFQLLCGSNVRGEWLGDTGEPIYRFYVDEHTGETSVYAYVCGKSREITRSDIPLEIKVLRNGIKPENESDAFRANDDLYLSFLSPISGYLAVFLLDATNQVVCMLPYQSQSNDAYPVTANQRYFFFSKEQATIMERALVDEYTITCDKKQETNYIYVVFSSQSFVKPVTNQGSISLEDFNIWRTRLLRQDLNAQIVFKTIVVRQ